MKSASEYTFKVSAGSSFDSLSTVAVNHENIPIQLDSLSFKGALIVRIKDFNGINPPGIPVMKNPISDYFNDKQRLYSISIQGQFMNEKTNGDDIVFGLELTGPVRTPPGTSIGLRIAKWLEPSLEYDLNCDFPWVSAPMISTMSALGVYQQEQFKKEFRVKDGTDWAFGETYLPESTQELFKETQEIIMNVKERKTYFAKKGHREKVEIRNDQICIMEFYDAHFDFENMRLMLPGFSLNANKYWDGQLIRFYCTSRDKSVMYFGIQFEYVEKILN